MATVYVLDPRGVRRALLVDRFVDRRDRKRCKVRVAGYKAALSLDPRLVFTEEADARSAWQRARAHQAELDRAGARLRVVDAHLSLMLGAGG